MTAESNLVRLARYRAKRDGLPFDLRTGDISVPSLCPVLGIPLVPCRGRPGPQSPSLDRVIPDLGYVRGNVTVISMRANALKNNATPEELRAIAAYVSTHPITRRKRR